MADPYTFSDTEVLRNRAGIRNAEALNIFEGAASTSRMETISGSIPMTAKGYCDIHRQIFQDVYDWAGQYRTIDMAKENSYFCRAPYIAQEMDARFRKLNGENDLRGIDAPRFAERAAEHLGELNAIHPFREGNGRTQRAFLVALGQQAGHDIDLRRISPKTWNEAAGLSFQKLDYSLLRDVIVGASSPSKEALAVPAQDERKKLLSQTEQNQEHQKNWAQIRSWLDDVAIIRPGRAKGKIFYDWPDSMTDAEVSRREALFDRYPNATKNALRDVFRLRDPQAFGAWKKSHEGGRDR